MITWVVPCHSSYLIATLERLCILLGIILLLNAVFLLHLMCSTFATWVASCGHRCPATSHWSVISDVPLPLIVVALHHYWCPPATDISLWHYTCFNVVYWGGSSLTKLCHFFFLGWLCVCFRYLIVAHLGWLCFTLDVLQPLTEVTLCHTRCFTATHWVDLHEHKCPTVANWYCFLTSQISHSHFLEWPHIVPLVPPLLPWVALYYFRYPTAAHLDGSTLPQVSHCCSV